MATNPIANLLQDWLPEMDFAVLSHGFVSFGSCYRFVIQTNLGSRPGTHALTLTHVAELSLETRLAPRAWLNSWMDIAQDARAEPEQPQDGPWSLAYPGIEAPEESPRAQKWSALFGKPMHFMTLETDRFFLQAVFHEAHARLISNDVSKISRVVMKSG